MAGQRSGATMAADRRPSRYSMKGSQQKGCSVGDAVDGRNHKQPPGM